MVSGDAEALRKVRENGVTAEYLSFELRPVFTFIMEYAEQYGAPPSLVLAESKLGVPLNDPLGNVDVPLEFAVTQVLDRRLHMTLRENLTPAIEFLGQGKPQDALSAAETAVRAARKELANGSKVETMRTIGPQLKDQYLRIKNGERGVLFPWPTMNEETFGLWPQDLGLFVGRLGKGKCLAAESLIEDTCSGRLLPLADFVASPAVDATTTWSPIAGIFPVTVTAKVDTGYKDCLRVVLESGREIVVTPEHPFLIPTGDWKAAERLRVGDAVGTPARMPFPSKPISLDKEAQARMYWHLLQLAGRAVDVRVWQTWKWTKKTLDLPHETNIRPKRFVPDRLPEGMFCLNSADLAEMLALLWVAKGTTHARSGITMAMDHERSARDLQHLMLRFGIVGVVSVGRWRKKDVWVYRVLPTHRHKLLTCLPLWGNFKARVEALTAAAVRMDDTPILPRTPEFVEYLRFLLGKFPVATWFRDGQIKQSSLQRRVKQRSGSEALAWLFHPDLRWERIVSITPVGRTKIFDLSVAGTHCFVANDVLVHNTWLAVNQTRYVWRVLKKKVLFATTEMSKVKIAQRIMAVDLQVCYDDLRKGRLGNFVEKKFFDGLDALLVDNTLGLVGGDFDFRPGPFLAAVEQFEPEIVILDGAYLLRVEGATRTERAANAFDELKRQANSTKIPHLVTMQFNRQVKSDKASSMDSGSIALTDVAGWNADLIYAIFQTEDMQKDKRAGLKPLKVREGAGKDDLIINWDFESMNFSEIPKDPSAAAPKGAFDSGLDALVPGIKVPDSPAPLLQDVGLEDPGSDEYLPDPFGGEF
jgi:replicative DNA helicase